MPGEPEFDRSVELYFDSKDDLERAVATPEMRACFEDHKNFMDTNVPANIRVYEIEVVVPLKREEYTGQLCKGIIPADEGTFLIKSAK